MSGANTPLALGSILQSGDNTLTCHRTLDAPNDLNTRMLA
jgi:hypothetical protein